MPNHVLTEIIIKTKDKSEQDFLINTLTTLKAGSTLMMDFNKIIPEPLTIEECPEDCKVNKDSHIEADEDRPWFDWYAWHNKYWGTKWNAYDGDTCDLPDGVLFTFCTAWSPATPIFKKLTLLGFDFEIKYADEDIGSNCGYIEYDAETDEWYEQFADDLDDPEAFAKELWGWEDEEDYEEDEE